MKIEIISAVIFYLLIVSGSVYCGIAHNDNRSGRWIPISMTVIMCVLFIIGILFNIGIGLIILITISVVLYGWSVYSLIRADNKLRRLWNILSPGMVIFTIFFLIVAHSIYGKVFDGWDEYSHWGDVVKAMVDLNDFGTNPLSSDMVASYPPGIPLIQYALCKIFDVFSGGKFAEWLCYLAHNALMISYTIPFVECKKKNPVYIITFVIVLFFSPMIFFYYDGYQKIYADIILGILTGCGFAAVLNDRDEESYRYIFIPSICFTLILVKDAGMLFAVMISATYIITIILNGILLKEKIKWICIQLLSVAIPKALWSYQLQITNTYKFFSTSYNFAELPSIITGTSDSYRVEVWKKFWKTYSQQKLGGGWITLNCFGWFCVIGGAILIVLTLSIINKDKQYIQNRIITFVMLLLTYAIYVFGMCISYMYKFTEYEALELASFSRYICIIYTAILFFLIMYFVSEFKEKTCLLFILPLCAIYVVAPHDYAKIYLQRYCVSNSIAFRENYHGIETAADKINGDVKTRICFVSQGDNDRFDYMICKFVVRPCTLMYNTLGEEMKKSDWITLIKEYDFFVLYNTSEKFISEYGDLFENELENGNSGIFYFDNTLNKAICYLGDQ